MADYAIGKLLDNDKKGYLAVDKLLEAEGLKRDPNLDYTCAVYDEEGEIVATGSCFANSLRCLAVSQQHQGEGLMNIVVTHLIDEQFARGNPHIFLYTKCDTAKFFESLSFHEITRIPNQIVFMENKRSGFADYLQNLTACSPTTQPNQRIAAIVMNANPFTLGHQFLVEQAALENDWVHLFIVSEDQSLVPFSVRKMLVQQGVSHLANVICHDSGDYIISSATFPSYFQENENAVIESNALLDLEIFSQIAKTLGIQRRYVGEEPFSRVTHLYNQIMQQKLPEHGIECVVIPRQSRGNQIISASKVRQCIKTGDFAQVQKMVPASTYDYFMSDAAQPVISRIQQTEQVEHY
ncbi:[citrate (pro-3S)-lyase] ligase [Haemophilus sputorum]